MRHGSVASNWATTVRCSSAFRWNAPVLVEPVKECSKATACEPLPVRGAISSFRPIPQVGDSGTTIRFTYVSDAELRDSILGGVSDGGGIMTHYRFYQIDQRGKVFTAPTVLQCRDDDEAISQSHGLVGEFQLEIWDGGRRVGTLVPEQSGLER